MKFNSNEAVESSAVDFSLSPDSRNMLMVILFAACIAVIFAALTSYTHSTYKYVEALRNKSNIIIVLERLIKDHCQAHKDLSKDEKLKIEFQDTLSK